MTFERKKKSVMFINNVFNMTFTWAFTKLEQENSICKGKPYFMYRFEWFCTYEKNLNTDELISLPCEI